MGVILCASPPSWMLPIWVGVLETYSLSKVLTVPVGPSAVLPRLNAPRGPGRIQMNSQELCVNGQAAWDDASRNSGFHDLKTYGCHTLHSDRHAGHVEQPADMMTGVLCRNCAWVWILSRRQQTILPIQPFAIGTAYGDSISKVA